jgi:hypothetical protein
MIVRKALVAAMVMGLAVTGCGYIVTPEDVSGPTQATSDKGWSAVVTNVSETSAGALHVDLALRNDTGDWSAVDLSTVARVKTSDGKSTTCATVFVGTGGTNLAPGFLMAGYTAGTKAAPVKQLMYVECAGVAKAAGMKLAVDYAYETGPFNYYVPSKVNKATLSANLDSVVSDLKFPVATSVPAVVVKIATKLDAINKCTVQLLDAKRTDTGLEFSWEVENPSEYPVYVHIGNPSVIGTDGVIYGFYESPHLADTPITLPGRTAQWTTTVSVPKDVIGLYILLSVESKQQKLFINHAVDITDK